MRTILITAASLLVLAPAAASAADSYRITQDGMDLEYTVTTLANGNRQFAGINNRTGERFLLEANRRTVTGKVGSTSVSFPVPATRTGARSTQVASR